MWKLIAAAAVAGAIFLYVTNRTCTLRCGTSVNREGMTAGLGTINALALYDGYGRQRCYGPNAEGSSSAFCTTGGYILT